MFIAFHFKNTAKDINTKIHWFSIDANDWFTNTAETVMEKVQNDFDKYVALIEKEASTTKLHHLLTKRSHVNVKLKVIPSGMSLKAKQGGAMNTAIEKTEEKTCKILFLHSKADTCPKQWPFLRNILLVLTCDS